MTKKLVFSFYINDNFHDEINEVHFKCLERFCGVFDCADISFIVDDGYNKEYLLEAESRFIKMFNGKDITFSITENTEFRESKVFYDKVATRLTEEDLVFFGHNKGITNVFKYDRNQIYVWVVAMYYFSLSYPEEIVDNLVNKKCYCYGPFLTKNEEPEKCNKYGWYYIGTFFWLNPKKVYQYMVNNGIDLPILSDRFYDEEFLGNIIQTWPLFMTASHGSHYLIKCGDFYRNATRYTRMMYDEDMEVFKEFYKEIVPNGKIDEDSQ